MAKKKRDESKQVKGFKMDGDKAVIETEDGSKIPVEIDLGAGQSINLKKAIDGCGSDLLKGMFEGVFGKCEDYDPEKHDKKK